MIEAFEGYILPHYMRVNYTVLTGLNEYVYCSSQSLKLSLNNYKHLCDYYYITNSIHVHIYA